MAEYIRVSSVKDKFTECPICFHEYDELEHLPRRMPCCLQAICHPCLGEILKNNTLLCPLCRYEHKLSGGVTSLPVMSLVLDHLKIKNFKKKIINLDQKAVKLEQQVKDLEKKKTNIRMSRERATEDVNRTTDNLIELLQTRRASLLSDVDIKSDNELQVIDEALDSTRTLLAKVKSSTEYTRRMRERADQVEDLQLMVSSTDSLNTMLQEAAQDVKFDRTGVTFAPVQVTEMKALIHVLGSVRSVIFTPAEKPSHVPAEDFYNAITMVPAELPQVTGFDKISSDARKLFISPHLELDSNTASNDITISSNIINNIGPDPAPQDTGCRLQKRWTALTLRPLPLRRGEVLVFCSRVVFTVKQLLEERKLLWETSLTHSPVDSNWAQASGVSVKVVVCPTHKQQLCLRVRYDGKRITDVPLCKYQIGASIEHSLCFMIDRDTSKIHVVDINAVKVVKTIPDVTLDRPLWVLMYVGDPSFSEMKSELISGREFNVKPKIKQLLIALV